MNVLSLFSGYEGLGLGLRLAGLDVRPVAYVEWDAYAQQIIQARIRDGYLDDAPIFGDISAFDGQQCRGVVDIITAGFPCPPFSTAGKRLGEADSRNMWPETKRVISEVGPRFVLLENVPGILVPNNGGTGYAGTVVGELSSLGYVGRYGLVPAAAAGAPHLRWRWWCLGYSRGERLEGGRVAGTVGHADSAP
ncbi:MAG: DNA cytosine methyltransferase [Chloroflexi bacterium]|nr:DNA cytosine methyltransferase [Chloroflexota bacterium]